MTKVSRFQVSVIPETQTEVKTKEAKREMKTGRFSVVTHEEGEIDEKDAGKSLTQMPSTNLLFGGANSNDFTSIAVSYFIFFQILKIILSVQNTRLL